MYILFTGQEVHTGKTCAYSFLQPLPILKINGTVFPNMDQLVKYMFSFIHKKQGPGLPANNEKKKKCPGLQLKIAKFCLLPEPIRLHDSQNSAH